MLDQASTLRSMLNAGDAVAPRAHAQRATRIVVAGSKRGVGATTVARWLVEGLNRQRMNSVLVPANKRDEDNNCRATVSDLAAGVSDAADVWQNADVALLVTTPEAMAMLDAYAALKRLSGPSNGRAVQILFNQCGDADAASELFARLHAACDRHLALEVSLADCLPLATSDALAECTKARGPSSASPTFRAIDRLARSVVSLSGARNASAIGANSVQEMSSTTTSHKMSETIQQRRMETPIHRRRIVTP